MGIREVVRKFTSSDMKSNISWKVDPYEGLDFILDKKSLSDPEKQAIENPFFGLQLIYLKGLVEQGLADQNSNGFTVHSSVVPDLGEDFCALFRLPDSFKGKYIT